MKLWGEHVMIRNEKGRPVGRDYINGIEGFWSYAKNWLYAYGACPGNTSICTWAKFATVTTIEAKTSNP
ncbi:MAG: hypothetical protein ABL928_15715 [Sphingorhabdus sp.]